VGSGVLTDNSFLTHLATGRLIVDGEGIPTSDPYTFTAAGEAWVVQSWLASTAYGALESAGGLTAVRLLMVALTAALGALSWTLTRPAASLLTRVVLTALALFIGSTMWSQRPLLFGLVALGLVLLATEDRLDPRLLVPVGWLWVNTHGSWPLGLVAVGCLAVGARLDGDDARVELRTAAWLAGGFALAVLNPYGPKLLVFPVALLSRREALSGIVEWQAMDFSRAAEWAFLGLVVLGIVGAVRRPSWRAAVPLVVFAAASFTGLRNVPVAVLVLLPGTARAFSDVGSMRWDRPSNLARPFALLGVVLGLLAVGVVQRTDDVDDDAYPIAADEWLREHDLSPASHRIVAREIVGNWFEAVYGATGTVFMDDRIEVLPLEVVEDHRVLLRGEPGWDDVLRRHAPDAVLWEAESPLAELLALSADWEVRFDDGDWIVATPA
jgi:hypothetical protein